MAWWAEQGTGTTATLRKADKKPGANWVQIPGATDSMTRAQAAQVLAQDIADGVFGESVGNGLRKAAGAIPGVNSTLSGVAAIGDFFNKLGDRNTWIRAAKIIVGGALLIIGLAHMTGASNGVATAARRVPVPVL